MNKKKYYVIALYVVALILFVPFLIMYIQSISFNEWGMEANKFYFLMVVISVMIAGFSTLLVIHKK